MAVLSPRTNEGRPARRSRWSDLWLLVPTVIFLLVLFAYPVLKLFSLSVLDKGSFTLEHYVKLFTTPVYLKVIWITIKIGGLTALLSLICGYPVAYMLAHTPERSRNMWLILVLLPFWTSFLVRTFVWMLLLNNTGLINKILIGLGLIETPIRLIGNLTGVLIGMVHALMPYAILTMVSVMQGIDKNLVNAAQILGARPGSAFWRVYFPLSLPGVAAGGLQVFITALGFFITPAFLGGPKEILISQAIEMQVNQLLNWGFASALSVVLLIITGVVFVFYSKALGTSTLYGSMAGQTRSVSRRAGARSALAGRFHIGQWLLSGMDQLVELWSKLFERSGAYAVARPPRPVGKYILVVAVGLVLLYLVAPIVLVIPVSFTKASFIDFPPTLFSLKWYQAYLNSQPWLSATFRSLQVASITALLATGLGTAAAFGLTRVNISGKGVLVALMLAPMIVPRMITAIGIYFLYSQLKLVGTTVGLVLAHTVLAVPYVIITVMAVLEGFDVRLEQAATILGATRWQAIRYVTLPIIRTGLMSAILMAFITSFDELTFALFLTGGMITTVPRRMWDEMTLNFNPTLAAVSTILVGMAVLFLVGTELARQRMEGRQRAANRG